MDARAGQGGRRAGAACTWSRACWPNWLHTTSPLSVLTSWASSTGVGALGLLPTAFPPLPAMPLPGQSCLMLGVSSPAGRESGPISEAGALQGQASSERRALPAFVK